MSENTNTNMTERVLDAIEQCGVTPKPRWHFLMRESVVWLVAGVALVVGAIATALTLYITEASFVLERRIAASELSAMFAMLPFVWIVLVVVAIFYMVHAVHTSEHGYRYCTRWLVSGALLVSVLLGYGLHSVGAGVVIDQYLLTHAPLYKPLSGFNHRHWMDPAKGVWVGVVVEHRPPIVVLRTIDGMQWNVTITNRTTVRGPFGVEPGMRVRVMGTTTSKSACEAHDIHQFRGRGAPLLKLSRS